jgi:two-component system nitrogen regulation sensor histidine kinase NtrY
VTTDDLVARLKLAAGSAIARLEQLGRRCAEAARRAWERLMQRAPTGAGGGPPDPLSDNAPPLPGTSDRAFRIGLIVVSLSVISGLATYLLLTGLTPIRPQARLVLGALFINLVLVIALVTVIAVQAAGLRRAWKQKVPGARLHARIVALFSLIAALPALLLAFAAFTTFSRAVDGWFNRETIAIVQKTTNIGKVYLLEHGQGIRTDAINMARDLDEAAPQVAGDAAKFRELVFAHATLRDLPAAYILDAKGAVKVSVLADAKVPYRTPPPELIALAEKGLVPLTMPSQTPGLEQENIPYLLVRDAKVTRVGAIIKLQSYPGLYLYVARGVAPEVVRHLIDTQKALGDYDRLKEGRGDLQLAYALMYFMITLTALSAAIWVGLWFAGLFVAPIRRLISAAQEVARGTSGGADPPRRGRPAPPVDELQRHDQGAGEPAHRARHHQPPALRPAPLHGGGAVGRLGGRHRPRPRRHRHPCQPLRREALARRAELWAPLAEGAGVRRPGGRRRRPGPAPRSSHAGHRRGERLSVRITRGADRGPRLGLTFNDIAGLVSAQRTSAWMTWRGASRTDQEPLPIRLSAEPRPKCSK